MFEVLPLPARCGHDWDVLTEPAGCLFYHSGVKVDACEKKVIRPRPGGM